MLWAQALSLVALWTVQIAVGVIPAFRDDKWQFDSSLKMCAGALIAFVGDETDPARIRQQAERVRVLDETFTGDGESLLKPGEYKSRYQVFDRAGHLLYRSPLAPAMSLAEGGPGFRRVDVRGEPYWVYVQDGPDGHVRVAVAESLHYRRRLGRRILGESPRIFLILFSILAVGTWLLSRRALRPLRRLAESVEQRKPGDLNPLQPSIDIAEIRPLVKAMNGLLERVSDLLETQRRFVADAAHELRTPLAVVRTQAHTLMEEEDPAQRAAIGQELHRGIERATGLVQQLLRVARLEAVPPDLIKGTLDLGRLARDRASLILPLALAKGQDLGVEGPESLEIHGNGSVLGLALDNLLENAIRYTPKGGIITLRLGLGVAGPFVEVEDDGPGMSEAFKARAFERFSREQGTHAVGAGLGLAIVRRAVELHRGRVELGAPSSASGLRVRIDLPSS